MTLPISAAHARELAALRALHPELPIVVIGAAAVGHHVPLSRTTADVDLVVVIAPADVAAMVEPLGWRHDARLSIRWHGHDGFRADVIPASAERLAAGVLELDDGDRVMSLLGLDLALAHAIDVPLPDTEHTIPVASAAALTVLKMVAWLDRPTERTRDLGDLATLLERNLVDDDPRRWDATHPLSAAAVRSTESVLPRTVRRRDRGRRALRCDRALPPGDARGRGALVRDDGAKRRTSRERWGRARPRDARVVPIRARRRAPRSGDHASRDCDVLRSAARRSLRATPERRLNVRWVLARALLSGPAT